MVSWVNWACFCSHLCCPLRSYGKITQFSIDLWIWLSISSLLLSSPKLPFIDVFQYFFLYCFQYFFIVLPAFTWVIYLLRQSDYRVSPHLPPYPLPSRRFNSAIVATASILLECFINSPHFGCSIAFSDWLSSRLSFHSTILSFYDVLPISWGFICIGISSRGRRCQVSQGITWIIRNLGLLTWMTLFWRLWLFCFLRLLIFIFRQWWL